LIRYLAPMPGFQNWTSDMAILVTRPQPDNASTAAALRARGWEVLAAPMLRFEKVILSFDPDADFGAVIVTSANALRALADQPVADHLLQLQLQLPLFAVGDRTAQAARDLGFARVFSAEGDAAALRELLTDSVKAKTLKKAATLLIWPAPICRAIWPANWGRVASPW
jgi:uroporphyrinogen-III synthase